MPLILSPRANTASPAALDIDRSVDVAVVFGGALGARPGPNLQWHLGHHMLAARAAFAGRVPLVDGRQLPDLPGCMPYCLEVMGDNGSKKSAKG